MPHSSASPRLRLLRFVLYGLPILLWMGVILVGSSTLGVYSASVKVFVRGIELLTPEQPPIPKTNDGVALTIDTFRVNNALRRLAHVLLYATLCALVVRALQGGEPRLKRSSLFGALLLSVLYVGVDEWMRVRTPERDAKWSDLVLNLIGVAAVLSGTVLFFALKAWERRLCATETPPPSEPPLPAA